MSSEPPSKWGQQQDKGLPAQDAGREHSADAWTWSWMSVAAVAAALVVAGGVAAFLFFYSGLDQPPEQAAPAQGLACPFLLRAADAYEKGDRVAFNREVARAAEVAEETLQKSGQVFGEPERIALELDLGSKEDVSILLERMDKACSVPAE
jgi:hypothetical protein